MTRKNISSNSPYEPTFGFSRAVRVGNVIHVSGTAPIADDGSTAAPGDPVGQTRRCLDIIKTAIEQAGGKLSDVVRTRTYVTDISLADVIGRTHGEYLRDVRPTSTIVQVTGFIREDWLVEIEAECVIDAD